jgi:ferredoxin/flavodoxin---NADP+ reductase
VRRLYFKRGLLSTAKSLSLPKQNSGCHFLELVPQGALTTRLWDLKVEDEVLLRNRIVGRFTLDESVMCHSMAATVTGAAPYISMVRTCA